MYVLACGHTLQGNKMRILERASAGAAWSVLSWSSQSFHDTQDLLDRMQKHVASDGRVHGLCVDFENTRVHIRDAHELWLVARLTAAYNNSLTAQQLQYEADLYGKPYAPEPCAPRGEGAAPDDVPPAGPDAPFAVVVNKKRKQKSKGRAPAVPETLAHTPVTQQRPAASADWDEELLGDRFIYDDE
jgi:hypothetical protein